MDLNETSIIWSLFDRRDICPFLHPLTFVLGKLGGLYADLKRLFQQINILTRIELFVYLIVLSHILVRKTQILLGCCPRKLFPAEIEVILGSFWSNIFLRERKFTAVGVSPIFHDPGFQQQLRNTPRFPRKDIIIV